jgi:hypothetical protein
MNYNDIDWLAQRFEEHADGFDEFCKKQRESYPDSEPVLDNFNLPRAFASICKRIRELENDNDTSKDQETPRA